MANDPVQLVEDEEGGRFLIYTGPDGPALDIRYDGDRLWMTQAQIAQLFGRHVSVISRHIAGVLSDAELDESNLQKMQIASSDRPVTLYSIDMVISVGYRVSSKEATLFRKWATDALVRFATKGFVVDARRLKVPENADRIAELRDIVRDIRADESNVYRELRRICAMCQDYDPASIAARDFYTRTQAKLVWAVTTQTPSEVVFARADAAAPDMGLRTWPQHNIRKADVAVAKAYLGDSELRELNRLTVILLDIFEDQLELGRLTLMTDAARLLDDQLHGLGRQVLSHGGRISHDEARAKAEREYRRFDAERREARHRQADAAIAEISRATAALPKARPKSPRKP